MRVVNAAEVARKAADLLEHDGWAGSPGPRRYSLSGALESIAQNESSLSEVRSALGTRITPLRHADEVIALLRQVATELEAS